MSNLLKQYYVVESGEGKRVMNYNALAEERIRSRMAESAALAEPKGGQTEAPAGGAEDAGAVPAPEFTPGIPVQAVVPQQPDTEEITQKLLADARAQADQVCADAKERAKLIVEDAQNQARLLYEEYKEMGYREGVQAREAELADLEQQLNMDALAREEDFKRRSEELEEDFGRRRETMEQNIIDALIPVFEKVFRIQFGDKREILLALAENVLANVELGNKLRIRANEADKAMLTEHLDEIKKQIGSEVSLELLLDAHMSDGQCQIETQYGVFDCSIDTEFANLIKDIRSLV